MAEIIAKVGSESGKEAEWTAFQVCGLVVFGAVFCCSVYANLSYLVGSSRDYRYFPPFAPGINHNDNALLGAEYFNIARSLANGEGFGNLFGIRTGPTAWMPPVLPTLEAGLLRTFNGNKTQVRWVITLLQTLTLAGTGLLVLALIHRTAGKMALWAGVVVYLALLVFGHFYLAFQHTHDNWLVLLTLDVFVAWLIWGQPLASRRQAIGWGIFGGLSALVNPVLAPVWGFHSLASGIRRRAWTHLIIAVTMAIGVVMPWTVRNYLVFGRLVPVKSNLAFELYQSQVVETDGVISEKAFRNHPYLGGQAERVEYRKLGEMAYMDRKREQFIEAVRADPGDFVKRVAARFLAATLIYVPFYRNEKQERPWAWWVSWLTHPLPFLSLVLLLILSRRQPLAAPIWVVIGTYLIYLAPYVVVGYYDRYGFPLVGMKVLLIVWAGGRLARMSLLSRERQTEHSSIGDTCLDRCYRER